MANMFAQKKFWIKYKFSIFASVCVCVWCHWTEVLWRSLNFIIENFQLNFHNLNHFLFHSFLMIQIGVLMNYNKKIAIQIVIWNVCLCRLFSIGVLRNWKTNKFVSFGWYCVSEINNCCYLSRCVCASVASFPDTRKSFSEFLWFIYSIWHFENVCIANCNNKRKRTQLHTGANRKILRPDTENRSKARKQRQTKIFMKLWQTTALLVFLPLFFSHVWLHLISVCRLRSHSTTIQIDP